MTDKVRVDLGGKSRNDPFQAHRAYIFDLSSNPIASKIRNLLCFGCRSPFGRFRALRFLVMPEHCHVLLCPKNEEAAMGEILTRSSGFSG